MLCDPLTTWVERESAQGSQNSGVAQSLDASTRPQAVNARPVKIKGGSAEKVTIG